MSWLSEGSLTSSKGPKVKKNIKDKMIWKQVERKYMRSQRKTNKTMEKDRITRWKTNCKEWSKHQNEKNEIKQLKLIQIENKTKKQKDNLIKHKEWFGDKMTLSRSWPEKTKENTLQIYGQNVNGVSQYNNYSEWGIILENIHNQQIYVACLTELNLDVTMAKVKYSMLKKAKKLDKNINLNMAGSKTTNHGRVAK